MESFTNTDLIQRWKDAFIYANGKEPDQTPVYEGGWFVFRNSFCVTNRSRRKVLIEAIQNLENRPKHI